MREGPKNKPIFKAERTYLAASSQRLVSHLGGDYSGSIFTLVHRGKLGCRSCMLHATRVCVLLAVALLASTSTAMQDQLSCKEGDLTTCAANGFYLNTVASQLEHDHLHAQSRIASLEKKTLTKSQKKKIAKDSKAHKRASEQLLESDAAAWYWQHAVTTRATFDTAYSRRAVTGSMAKAKASDMLVRYNVVPQGVLPPRCRTCNEHINTLDEEEPFRTGSNLPLAEKPDSMSDDGWRMATTG